jgi:predicted nucleic acid-binding protein
MLIALDSDVIIAALSPKEEHSSNAQQLIRNVADGKYKVVVSSLVYGEVLSVSTGSQELDLEDFMLHIKNISAVAADDGICLKAGKLRLEYGSSLRLPDAIHLVTAIDNHADLFVTNDIKLAIPTKLLSEWD